jgi:hypothetical protein
MIFWRCLMVVLLVLFTFIAFLVIDWFVMPRPQPVRKTRGTMYTTPGFEMLGALAQDGGKKIENDYQI